MVSDSVSQNYLRLLICFVQEGSILKGWSCCEGFVKGKADGLLLAPKISCLENVSHKHNYGIFLALFFFSFALSQAFFSLLHLDHLKTQAHQLIRGSLLVIQY